MFQSGFDNSNVRRLQVCIEDTIWHHYTMLLRKKTSIRDAQDVVAWLSIDNVAWYHRVRVWKYCNCLTAD